MPLFCSYLAPLRLACSLVHAWAGQLMNEGLTLFAHHADQGETLSCIVSNQQLASGVPAVSHSIVMNATCGSRQFLAHDLTS